MQTVTTIGVDIAKPTRGRPHMAPGRTSTFARLVSAFWVPDQTWQTSTVISGFDPKRSWGPPNLRAKPARWMACCTNPEALAFSINSLM
jgi:hypothetical protein